ncbi:hypothetical protein TGFOU_406820 [Toxoplasma gondii FOU]|uniref:Uncharacterized protein n=2 Tax=Toxoplasma gondii TaxID=5811 RepID=A0A086JG54_TOXGO|nr:hypothetical protein TGFOU_406820 [Toxoplasma gondii FOU]RQX73953.1 hypothetical protein TGCAST_264830C [Toxoplasma gondii CAST]
MSVASRPVGVLRSLLSFSLLAARSPLSSCFFTVQMRTSLPPKPRLSSEVSQLRVSPRVLQPPERGGRDDQTQTGDARASERNDGIKTLQATARTQEKGETAERETFRNCKRCGQPRERTEEVKRNETRGYRQI